MDKIKISISSKSTEMYLKASSEIIANFEDVFKSNEKQLSTIKNEAGDSITRSIVFIEVTKILELLDKSKLNETQINQIIDNILQDFWYFKIADFALIRKRLSYVKQYGSADIGDIMSEISQYAIERDGKSEYLSDEEIFKREAEKEIEDKRINELVKKTYSVLKKKAKEPIKTQKQKDAENMKAHIEKLAEFEKIYPKTK